jgi:hypothetical protein
MRTTSFALLSGLLLSACGNGGGSARRDANLSADADRASDSSQVKDAPLDQVNLVGDTAQERVVPPAEPDSGAGDRALPADSDGAVADTNRDPTKVQTVALTAAPSFSGPTAPFLQRSDLTRTPDGLFDFKATVLVKLSACSGEACLQYVSMTLSREQTTRVESSLALIPGVACLTDPGPICDFGTVYAIGIDGPLQNQTCCKRNDWGQNINVERLHGYLRDLAFAQLGFLEGSRDGSVGG